MMQIIGLVANSTSDLLVGNGNNDNSPGSTKQFNHNEAYLITRANYVCNLEEQFKKNERE